MSERTARLDELLREEINDVIRREVDDPRIGFLTITDVEVSPDLSHANVWVSVIGSAEEKKLTLRAVRGTRVMRILEELEQGGTGELDAPIDTLPSPGKKAPDADDGT